MNQIRVSEEVVCSDTLIFYIPKLAQVVVFPTPPFWLATAMICVFIMFHLVSVDCVRFWK